MPPQPTELEMRLWKLAKKRAGFRRHLIIYIIIIGFLWAIWLITDNVKSGLPWPIWPALVWGVFVVFHYFNVYQGNREEIAREEYEKLLKKKEEQL